MNIKITPREEISLEYDLYKIKSTPNSILDFTTGGHIEGDIKEVGVLAQFKITYYLIFTDTSTNTELLNNLIQVTCLIKNTGISKDEDLKELLEFNEVMYSELWNSLRVKIPYLNQLILKTPYLHLEFSENMLSFLIENNFYHQSNE